MKERIRKIIERITERKITNDDEPIEMDSIDTMEVIVSLEYEYDIHIDTIIKEDLSLNDYVELVRSMV